MGYRTASALAVTALAVGLSLTACSSTSSHPAATGASPVRLPSSFPKRAVPVIAGNLLVASGNVADGWSVTVDPTDGNLASAEFSLKKSGFTVERTTDNSATLDDEHYTVTVQSPGRTVTYLVTSDSSADRTAP